MVKKEFSGINPGNLMSKSSRELGEPIGYDLEKIRKRDGDFERNELTEQELNKIIQRRKR